MSPHAEPSASNSALALSLLYVEEVSLLLSKVRRMLLLAVIVSAALLVIPIVVLAAFSESVEEMMPFEEEILVGFTAIFLTIPVAAYFTFLSTRSMDRWKHRLDSLSFAIGFESQASHGDSPSIKLANQTINALHGHPSEQTSLLDSSQYANLRLGTDTFDVIIPDRIVRQLSGHKGAVVAKRFESKTVSESDLRNALTTVRSAGVRLWRLLIVSNVSFPAEVTEYHSSQTASGGPFPVDLIEETPSGFSVVALGT